MRVSRFAMDPRALILIAVGALLLLTHLGNGRLWQDEAETAVLGKNTLRYGYPKTFDGVNLLNPSLQFQKGFAWIYHSWLPIYLVAGSFALFGATTTTARFPSALLGVGALWLAYLLAKRLTGSRRLALWTLLTLSTSVPFLLHMRQCRYYAPAAFFTLWTTLSYWRFFLGRRWAPLELTCSLMLLFHADHGVFVPVAAAFASHFALSRPTPQMWRKGWGVLLLVLVLTVPWAIYLRSWQHHRGFSFKEVSHHFQFYFRQINGFLTPLIFWAILIPFFRTPFRELFAEPRSIQRQGWKLIGCLIGIGLLFLIFVPEQRHFRYLIFLAPFLFMVQATLLEEIICRRSGIGVSLALLLLLAVNRSQSQIRIPLVEFIGELTHSYRGPVDGIIDYLQTHARPGESVKTPYEEHPIIFYTDLAVEPIRSVEDFSTQTYPDWIVLRRDWLPAGFLESSYYREIQKKYKRLLLDAPDIPWQNRPDPGYHRFRTDTQAPPVVLFHKGQ